MGSFTERQTSNSDVAKAETWCRCHSYSKPRKRGRDLVYYQTDLQTCWKGWG